MHKRLGWKGSAGIALLVGALLALLSLATWAQGVKIKTGAPQPSKSQGLFKTEKYDLMTLYMHEVFEHYNKAKDYFKDKNYDLAGTSLRVMDFYANKTKEVLPDQVTVVEAGQEPKTVKLDKPQYLQSVDQLIKYSGQAQATIPKGQWPGAGAGQKDPVMETCVSCHNAQKIPTDFHINTDFKILTKLMHEVYYHYRDAGPLLQQEKWDQALDLLVVLDPYLEQIPNHIPAVNEEDQQPIDKDLFLKAHKELTQFTHDTVAKLRTKSWQSGKPLPPPRVVVDNCYQCHKKVAKIPSPW